MIWYAFLIQLACKRIRLIQQCYLQLLSLRNFFLGFLLMLLMIFVVFIDQIMLSSPKYIGPQEVT